MEIHLERRAEIAQRSLQPSEKEKIARALEFLFAAKPIDISQDRRISKLKLGGGEQLFSFRSSPRLRVVFSIQDNVIVVQDIVDNDRLKRWTGGQG